MGAMRGQPPTLSQAPALDPTHVRAPVFEPTSGPPGTSVTVRSQSLPALTPIYLGIGAARSSFEVLSELVTDERGELERVVVIPSWATADRSHYFVLVDVYFRPLAVSRPFHVTNPDGTIVRRGRITGEGVTCLALREDTEDQELYTLAGAVDGLAVGEQVVVTGRIAEVSVCMQGTTITTDRIER